MSSNCQCRFGLRTQYRPGSNIRATDMEAIAKLLNYAEGRGCTLRQNGLGGLVVEVDREETRRNEPWTCLLSTRMVGETEIPTVRVYPGPRGVIGGWAEWCAPHSGFPPPPFWEFDQPHASNWCVVVRYRHPQPDWSTGGILNGEWTKPWYDAPELLEGSPGSSGVRDTAEYRVFVLAWSSNTVLRQLTTGMLSVIPILDRAACLTPPEEP